MTEYIVSQIKKNEYYIFRIEGEHEILEKIYNELSDIEMYITLKNGYIKEFKKLEKDERIKSIKS